MTRHTDTRPPEATLQTVKDALRSNAEELIDFTAKRLAHLGARLEWGSEDNFEVTETLAGVLAPRWGLPSAASLNDAAALAFWSTIAVDDLGQEIDAVDGYPAGGTNTAVS